MVPNAGKEVLMKSLITKKNASSVTVAQCCAKTSQNAVGCHN